MLLGRGAISAIRVGIHGRRQPFGLLGAYSRTLREFTTNDLHFLEAVANVLATAIDRKRGEEAQEESARFACSVVDALEADIAILDERGCVLAVNQASRRFATANGMSDDCLAAGTSHVSLCYALCRPE